MKNNINSKLRLHPLTVAIALALGAPVFAQTSQADALLPEVKVTAARDRGTDNTGSYTARSANAATRLDLTLRETPQSVTVLPRALIDDFVLNDVNDLLATATGVNVERVEPERSYFSVRGFEVSNFQVDGIGLPFATGDQIGNLDTALYERVEVLRGANGLMSFTGNPAATVNFVRKRPTRDFHTSAALTAGSWEKRRLDADISGALNVAGTVRGRFTAAAQDGDSWLDRYSLTKHLFGAMLEADLTPATMLAIGHSAQHNRPKGVMWGSLPLFYTDGTPTAYPLSASSAPRWTYWDTNDVQSFAELSHRLSGGWQARGMLMRRVISSDSELFYVYGTPVRGAGTGLFTFPSKYGHTERQRIADASLTGPFTLGGRRHELVLGANWGKSDNRLDSSNDDSNLPLTESELLAGSFPRPAFDQGPNGGFADFANRRTSLYATARWNAADALKIITGVNATRATSRGVQYGTVHDYNETKVSPYLGATIDLDARHSLYASYSTIYNPQYEADASRRILPPIDGSNAEAGVKGEWMNGRLNGSFAVFRMAQDNKAEVAGFDAVAGRTFYRGVDATSTGFEIDVAGRLAPGWEMGGGYTQLRIKDPAGASVRTYVPRKTLRLTTSYRWASLPALKTGASLKWQSDYQRTDGAVVTRQPAYALLDLAATYAISRGLDLTAKIGNITNKKHLNSLMWPGQAFYGSSRNGSVTLRWTY